MKFIVQSIICLFLLSITGYSQQTAGELHPGTDGNNNMVKMPAGAQFGASHWKQLWWGKHWRNEWTTPVSFPIFNLDTTAGGLIALQRGGGHETKSLRLIGGNGKEYVLRTMEKSLDILIPEIFRGSFLNDLVNDQVSLAHPYGPLVVAQLSESINILHANPIIVFVPESKRLGEFSKEFAHQLCLFEERPSGEGWEQTNLTRMSDVIVNTEKLVGKILRDPDNMVDQKAYLKVRLFDMLINDWDRHDDQWIWAGKKVNGKTIYEAFARDRDQSLSRTDGICLYFLSRPWAIRSLQNMDNTLTDVIGNNLSATGLDKRFTNQLSEMDWRNTIQDLRELLTDSVIHEALLKMPPEIFTLSGKFIMERLCSRRDHMMDYGMQYFRILNKEVIIIGTEEDEIFLIDKKNKESTALTILSENKKGKSDTIYQRFFFKSITDIVNIYGMDGNDQFQYSGINNNGILIRSIGGAGKDIFTDSISKISATRKNPVYDAPEDTKMITGNFRIHVTVDSSITVPHPKAFKYDWWMPLIVPGYNPDDGAVIGAGFMYRKMRWHKSPYSWEQTVSGKYAFATGAFSLFYKGIFKELAGKWDLEMTAHYKAPSFVVNFYGFGNDTKLQTDEKSFYRVRARSVFVNPMLTRNWFRQNLNAGLIFETVEVESADNKFINQFIGVVDSSVFKTKRFGGTNFGYTWNTSDNLKYPTKGVKIHGGFSYTVNLDKTRRDFANFQSSFTFYYTPFKNLTVAHRTGGAANIGDYEFYQANTIGGAENLRGYWRTRFTGRSSFYQNTDIRWKIADLKSYILRGAFGIYGFFDDGRVWMSDEHSNTIHTGYGGGIYLIPFSTLAINLSYASSGETNTFTFRTGFLF